MKIRQTKLQRAKFTRIPLAALIVTVCTLSAPSNATAQNKLPKKQHRTSNAPFLKPTEAVKKMSIPNGFDVSIYASEPDIAEPIAFCFDPRGRVWVLENFNYRTRKNHTDEKVTRIQILEDTDSDGIFDKKKTFTDKLTFSSGIAVGFGGVYVGSPPNLTFIPDADGDDVPDGEPEILLDGWGINDRHETLNSFIWGPDGWLYGCHGVFTKSRVGKPGDDDSVRQFIDGGIWRFHPERKKFEIFARGLSNPWGFDFDDTGQSFATCCVIPHLFHVIQGGVYHKQSLPHVNPHIYDDIKTIRDHSHLSAHGGARFYLADAFPVEYHDRLFMCNIHEHAVLTDVMVRRGSGFVGKHGDDFLPTNDLAWVGFSVEIGPEGGVYILDWHDTDICGNQINFANSGRIYRIMPKEAKPIKRPNLEKMSDMELVGLQDHANDWYVRHARVLLHSRTLAGKLNKSDVHAGLNKMMSNASTSGKKLRALWALHVTGALDTKRLSGLLDHADENIRAWAIQLLTDKSSMDAFNHVTRNKDASPLSPETQQRFVAMSKNDGSPIVRLYLAAATQRLPFADRWPILSELAKHEEDVNDHNLSRMIWFSLEPMVPGNKKQALLLASAGKMPMLQKHVARRMTSGDVVVDMSKRKKKNAQQDPAKWPAIIAKAAPDFSVKNVGEGGVVYHTTFRNRTAVQTHPLDRKTPCRLSQKVNVPSNKKTNLQMKVSHHPHGDWQLRVLVDGQVVKDQIVSSKTVTKEWLDVDVDLSSYAGKSIELALENRANNWNCEWAYWHEVKVVSK